MHPEYRFSDLAESLKNGFLVDEIVLALARAEKGEALGERERSLLAQAATLLEKAEAGYHWLDDPKLTTETRSTASFFGQAVGAMPKVYTPEVFLRSLHEMKETASELSSGSARPAADKLRLLRTFFFNAAQSELDRTEQLLAGDSGGGALKWTATSR
jgi:hypothetical protein